MTSLPSAKPEPLDVTCIEQRLDVLSLRSRMCSVSGTTVGSKASSLLVILHYLLKNNTRDFNTGGCKNQLGESPDDPPKNAWGAWPKWEDQR